MAIYFECITCKHYQKKTTKNGVVTDYCGKWEKFFIGRFLSKTTPKELNCKEKEE